MLTGTLLETITIYNHHHCAKPLHRNKSVKMFVTISFYVAFIWKYASLVIRPEEDLFIVESDYIAQFCKHIVQSFINRIFFVLISR